MILNRTIIIVITTSTATKITTTNDNNCGGGGNDIVKVCNNVKCDSLKFKKSLRYFIF